MAKKKSAKFFRSFLIWLILVGLIKGIIWSFFVPVWHFPDEQAHFAQISYYGETGKMPPVSGNDLSREIFISEQLLGTERDWAGVNKFTYHPEFNIEYTNDLIGRYEKKIANLPLEDRKIMVRKEAAGYPPLYYGLMSIAYRMAAKENLFSRVMIIRLFNIIFFVLLMIFVYEFYLLFFDKDKLLTLTASVFVLFQPMLTFVSSGINSDNLFNLIFAIGIYHGFILLRRRMKLKDILLFFLLLLMAKYTKPQWRLLPLIYLFPFIFQWVNRQLDRKYFIGGIFLAIISISLIVRSFLQGKQILPNVSLTQVNDSNFNFFGYLESAFKLTFRQTIPWYWGVFKWLGVVLPIQIIRAINRIMLSSALGVVYYVIKKLKRKKIKSLIEFFYLIYVSSFYFLAIIIFDYFFTRQHGFSIGIQGRYFFPVISTHMALLLIGIMVIIPHQIRNMAVKSTGVAMIVLNFIAFYTMVKSYYPTGDLFQFFIKASQYKPWYAKYPYLPIWLTSYILVSSAFIYKFLSCSPNESKSRS